MLAFVAAAFFGVAALLAGATVRLGPLTPSVFLAVGLAFLALHVAGLSVGTASGKDRSQARL